MRGRGPDWLAEALPPVAWRCGAVERREERRTGILPGKARAVLSIAAGEV
jgi:hypothetical protein